MFKVINKKNGDIYDVLAVTKIDGYTKFFCFIDGGWVWLLPTSLTPYVVNEIDPTAEYLSIDATIILGEEKQYITAIRQTKEEADEYIKDFDAESRDDIGNYMPGITSISYNTNIVTMQQLKSFLTVTEYNELIKTGRVG